MRFLAVLVSVAVTYSLCWAGAVAKQDVAVELFYDGDWQSATTATRTDGTSIFRGLAEESQEPTPGRAALTLDNRDGSKNPNNPASPLYGAAGRNTPGRVSVGSSVRLVGEAAAWKPRRAVKGDAVTVVDVAGILRRLGRGQKPLRSPLFREHVLHSSTAVYYWALEDGPGSTQAASGLPGGPPMVLSGDVGLGLGEGYLGSSPILNLASKGGTLTASNLTGVPTDFWVVEWVARHPEFNGSTTRQPITWYTTGSLRQWDVIADSGTNILATDSGGTGVGSLADWWQSDLHNDNSFHHYSVEASQVGGDIQIVSRLDGATTNVDFYTGTLGPITEIRINPLMQSTLGDMPAVGHLAVYTGASSRTPDAAFGWQGETAGNRFLRLCDEEGITCTVVGDEDDTEEMGPQAVGTLVALLTECARTDAALLFETRDEAGLTFRTGRNLYNQSSVLDLDYEGQHIAPPLVPLVGDVDVRNDVTASRPGGSSAQAVLETGRMSVQAPPDGVGRYDSQLDVNPYDDGRLIHAAWWHVHKGTADETRYLQVTVDLDAPAAAGLVDQVDAVDIGDVITIANLPVDEYQGVAALLVLAVAEDIGSHRRLVTFTTVPESTYEVEEVETSGSTIVVARAVNDTSLKLATSLGREWVTGSPLSRPFHVQIGGEAMQVTTLTTDTPAFVAAGAASHANNANVTPGLPAGMTPDVGQLMLLLAAIRNSGTGTVDVPTGWASLVEFGNVRLMYRYYVTGDAGPTVTFTGGVANADTSAQIAAFSGLSHELASGTKAVPAAATVLNGSAANITTPAATVRRDGGVKLWIGWRQQDWTSVATLAAADAEIGEPDTATGDNQGLVWDYDVFTTASDIAADAFVVTGGVNGISRGITLALRPLQTATVVRGVNDVSVSLAAGSAVTGWRLGVNGL